MQKVMRLLSLTPDSLSKSQAKSPMRKWPLFVVLLAALSGAATLPLQGRPDLVIRPLTVIALLLFIGTQIDRRR